MSREHTASALRRLRERSGLTADDVGAKIGKSGKTVNAWENNRGQPDIETLLLLCKIYNVDSITDEFNEDAKKSPPSELDDEESERKKLFDMLIQLSDDNLILLNDYLDYLLWRQNH